MAHLFSLMRDLHEANRQMPARGATHFKELKKAYGKGQELRGKTLGIIGFGRIGQWTARYAIGAGMNVIVNDSRSGAHQLAVPLGGGHTVAAVSIEHVSLEDLLKRSDAISLHVPAQPNGRPVIGAEEIARMKDGAVLVNAARGGSVDEDALLAALKRRQIAGGGARRVRERADPAHRSAHGAPAIAEPAYRRGHGRGAGSDRRGDRHRSSSSITRRRAWGPCLTAGRHDPDRALPRLATRTGQGAPGGLAQLRQLHQRSSSRRSSAAIPFSFLHIVHPDMGRTCT